MRSYCTYLVDAVIYLAVGNVDVQSQCVALVEE